MKTLVLNVDRDDDFGRKAKVKSPIIGLKNNIDAANKLGQVDPEDSDLNAIFSAISTYKTLIDEGKNVEIATICGHINVGLKSDEILSKQLEEVLDKTEADNVILLSDGAEDEYVLPIVQSRIKITSVRRVSVKQSKELEDTYYRIIKLLEDEKVLKQFFLPIALVLIVWSVFVYLDMTRAGFGTILLTLGGYLLIRVFRWEKTIAFMWEEMKSGFLTGRLSLWTSTLAVVILIAFVFLGYNTTDFSHTVEIIPILFFISKIVSGIVIAGLIIVFGRAIDVYVKDKKTPWKYWIFPFSILAFGFIIYAISYSMYYAFVDWPGNFSLSPFMTVTFIGCTSTGILIAIIGGVTYHYIKEIYRTEDKKIEIEKETATLVEKS